MIRHARLAPSLAILPLAVAVVESPFKTLLVPAIRRTPLTQSRLLPAGQAAITLPMVAVGAEEKQCAALGKKAKPLPQNHFAIRRHAGSQAALDNGSGFVAG